MASVTNIGHRGAAGLEPENTMRSFRRAEREGADALELDVRVTRDGHMVIMHDATVERTTDGAGAVSDLLLSQMRRLDAGGGQTVPTFGEVLQSTEISIQAEVKDSGAAVALSEAMREDGVRDRVTPVSDDLDALEVLRAAEPGCPVGVVVTSGEWSAALGLGEAVSANWLSVRRSVIKTAPKGSVRQAQRPVWVWTVNQPKEMRELADIGVDGIVTDRPDVLAAVLSGRR